MRLRARRGNTVQKNKINVWRCALSGACAGLVNGFFGGGGGMLLIPLFTRWCGLADKPAFATCVAVIAPLCAVSAAMYFFRGGLDWALAWPYLAGGLVGGLVAGRTFEKVPAKLLRRILALLILYGGIKAWF